MLYCVVYQDSGCLPVARDWHPVRCHQLAERAGPVQSPYRPVNEHQASPRAWHWPSHPGCRLPLSALRWEQWVDLFNFYHTNCKCWATFLVLLCLNLFCWYYTKNIRIIWHFTFKRVNVIAYDDAAIEFTCLELWMMQRKRIVSDALSIHVLRKIPIDLRSILILDTIILSGHLSKSHQIIELNLISWQ